MVTVSRFIKVVGRRSKQQSPNWYVAATICLKPKFLTRITIPPVRPLSADLHVKPWACFQVHAKQGSCLFKRCGAFFLFTSTAGELFKIGCCKDWLACVGSCLLVTHQKKKGKKKERKACPSIMRPLDGLMRLTLNIKTYVSSNILQVVSLQTY